MDLRSIINTDTTEASLPRAPPVTPIQAVPPQSFRDYGHPQASQGKLPSSECASQPGGPYASPNTYHGAYPARQPAPIQAPPQNDLRSPAGSYSAQSPYRMTPSSSTSNNQYPFPQSNQTPQSPAQHPQYLPPYPQRDGGHPQPDGPQTSLYHPNSHSQLSPAPQTPPIGIPGAHPYIHHPRSQSSVSSTSTSAQSQPYYSHQLQDSPVLVNQTAPQIPLHQRQQSQPGTPLGPPLPGQRQQLGNFSQATSPYQQRALPVAPIPQYQTSPAAQPPAHLPTRLPPNTTGYESQRISSNDPPQILNEREQSLSVSPKTRLPSQLASISQVQLQPFPSTKRKMDDPEAPVEKPRRIEEANVKPPVNGEVQTTHNDTSSPQQPRKKRKRYTEPPIWARSVRTHGTKHGLSKVNGKQNIGNATNAVAAPLIGQEGNGHRQITPPTNRSVGPPDEGPLGPWEESILGERPQEELTRVVADFLYQNVVARPDYNQLASRGVEVEVEAKLGQLMDKSLREPERFKLPLMTECIVSLQDKGFKSSMTEGQHRHLNQYLNKKVEETHPNNPKKTKPRVPIDYKRRIEEDKLFELPSSVRQTLPPAVFHNLKSEKRQAIRISNDQTTTPPTEIARIIKVRVADMDIFMPRLKLDCRISVNLEMKYESDIEHLTPSSDTRSRLKNRLSYTQSHYQIDLTQVTSERVYNNTERTEVEHEVEIECSTKALREQGLAAKDKQKNGYVRLVEGFIDNVRVLAREVSKVQ